MKKLKYALICCILMTFIVSCDTTIIRNNKKDDMNNVEAFTAEFYTYLSKHDIDSAAMLFGSELPYNDGLKLLQSVRGIRGEFIDATTDSMGTNVVLVNGSVTSVESNIYMNCIYDRGESKEKLSIRGKDFGDLKIIGYQFTLK